MKNFQQNLLMGLALALCVLCVFQWREQTLQRNAITALNEMVYQKNSDTETATNSIATLNHQVAQMDARLSEVKAAAATNEQLVFSQKAEITRLQRANLNLTNAVASYHEAVDALESKLKESYAGIEKQNEAVTNLVAERDSLVQKYNDEVKDRNDIVAKYNDLAGQVEKLRGAQK